VGCIRAQPDLIAFDARHHGFDQFSGGQFNNDGFARTAGNDEYGKLLLPGCLNSTSRVALGL
jgi:hypothetical protein